MKHLTAIALASLLTLPAPAFAAPDEAIANEEYPPRIPWVAAILPLVGPTTFLVTRELSSVALSPSFGALGVIYAGDVQKGLLYQFGGSALSLGYIGSLLFRSCGRTLEPCTRFDASPYFLGASFALSAWMSVSTRRVLIEASGSAKEIQVIADITAR